MLTTGAGVPERDQRPGCGTEAPEVTLAGVTTIVATETGDVVRCSRCRHPLTAPASVEVEIGPVCRKAVAA